MSKESKLTVEPRSAAGTRACRRLRREGLVPGNIYGHGAEATTVQVDHAVLRALIYGGVKVVDVDCEGRVDKAVVREVQFDALGQEITHFDLMRVDANERVTVHVPVEIKGTAPGVVAGGILDQPLHAVTMDVLAYQIPDSIPVRVGTLEIGQSIYVRDLVVPESAHLQHAPDAIVVHVVQVQAPVLTAADGSVGAEPEVIGKKPAEGDAAADKGKDAGKKK